MFSPVHVVGLDCALKHEVDRAVLKRKECVFVCVLVWLPLHKITSSFCCDAVKGFDTVVETAGPGRSEKNFLSGLTKSDLCGVFPADPGLFYLLVGSSFHSRYGRPRCTAPVGRDVW